MLKRSLALRQTSQLGRSARHVRTITSTGFRHTSSHIQIPQPPVLRASNLGDAVSSKGPVRNRAWAPASSSYIKPFIDNATYIQNPSRARPAEAPRIRHHGLRSRVARFSTSTSFLTPSPNSSSKTEDSTNQTGSQGLSPSDPPQQQALPDLRQGIPSTFDQEISSNSSSAQNTSTKSGALDLVDDTPEDAEGRGQGGEETREAYKSSIDRRRETMAFYGFLVGGAILLSGFVTLGQNWDEREARAHPNIPNGWAPGAVYDRARTRLSETLGYYTEPAFPQLLPDVDPAYRPSPYTLVLSLEDLLVHSKWTRQNGWEVAKRPGVDYFIRYLSQYYELVLFTSVPSMNGLPVYSKLDPFHFIMFPLFREATRYMNGHHVKDLSYLNRDLSKLIVIDTNADHLKLNPENAVILPKWSGHPRDERTNDLVALIPFLEYIAGMNIDDVRKMIKSFEGTDIPKEYAKREARMRESFQKDHEKGGAKSSIASTAKGFSNVLGFKQGPQPGQLPGEAPISDNLSQGKMLIDQVREWGRIQYEYMERDIQRNGQKWLEDQEREDKKAMEEQMKSMKNEWMSWPFRSFSHPSERQ